MYYIITILLKLYDDDGGDDLSGRFSATEKVVFFLLEQQQAFGGWRKIEEREARVRVCTFRWVVKTRCSTCMQMCLAIGRSVSPSCTHTHTFRLLLLLASILLDLSICIHILLLLGCLSKYVVNFPGRSVGLMLFLECNVLLLISIKPHSCVTTSLSQSVSDDINNFNPLPTYLLCRFYMGQPHQLSCRAANHFHKAPSHCRGGRVVPSCCLLTWCWLRVFQLLAFEQR